MIRAVQEPKSMAGYDAVVARVASDCSRVIGVV